MLQPLLCPYLLFEEGGMDCYDSWPFTPPGHQWVVAEVDHLNRYAQGDPPSGWDVVVAEAFAHCTCFAPLNKTRSSELQYKRIFFSGITPK